MRLTIDFKSSALRLCPISTHHDLLPTGTGCFCTSQDPVLPETHIQHWNARPGLICFLFGNVQISSGAKYEGWIRRFEVDDLPRPCHHTISGSKGTVQGRDQGVLGLSRRVRVLFFHGLYPLMSRWVPKMDPIDTEGHNEMKEAHGTGFINGPIPLSEAGEGSAEIADKVV